VWILFFCLQAEVRGMFFKNAIFKILIIIVSNYSDVMTIRFSKVTVEVRGPYRITCCQPCGDIVTPLCATCDEYVLASGEVKMVVKNSIIDLYHTICTIIIVHTQTRIDSVLSHRKTPPFFRSFELPITRILLKLLLINVYNIRCA